MSPSTHVIDARIAVAIFAATLGVTSSAAESGTPLARYTPVTDALLTQPGTADWLSYRGNLAGWGYSTLTTIDRANVATLTLAWSAPMNAGPVMATPLVHDGVMFVPHPGDVIQALDARNGDPLWEYRRKLPEDLHAPSPGGGVSGAVLSGRTRTLALYQDLVYTTTADAAMVALEARTGKPRWETRIGSYYDFTHTSGPIAGKGKIFSGRTCDLTLPGGCFISAHDAATGRELWRTNVIARPGEPGGDTWGEAPLNRRVHAGAWGVGSFDPDLNLLVWGTSVPAPAPEILRGTLDNDMLYTNSTLGLDADSGKMRWYFQHLPRDNWDLDHAFERILIDGPVAPDPRATWVHNPKLEPGEVRKVVTGIPGKTGLVWTLDRTTGEFLWTRPTVMQNVVRAVDPATGRVTVNDDVIPKSVNDNYGLVCPSAAGGKNWWPGAYDPKANVMFMPLENLCMEPEIATATPGVADIYAIGFNVRLAPDTVNVGRLEAIAADTGRTLWKHEQRAGVFAALATAGGLVFVGNADRRFQAFDSATGELVWETVLNGPVTGHPVTYAVDGRQFVAVAAGGGDFHSGSFNALAGLPTTTGANMLYVFALPQTPVARSYTPPPDSLLALMSAQATAALAAPTYTQAQAARGKLVYTAHCARCHGEALRGGIAGPSLTGRAFKRRFGAHSVAQLYEVIWTTMPIGQGRSLDARSVSDVIAYWLQFDGQPAGATELPAERTALANLRLMRAP